MKKVIYMLIALVTMNAVSFAQNTNTKMAPKAKTMQAKTTATTTAKTADQKAATTAKTTATKAKTTSASVRTTHGAATTAKTKTTTTKAGPVKKDGTPDMRYKANKNAATTPKK